MVRKMARSLPPSVAAASVSAGSIDEKPSESVTSGSVTKKMAWAMTAVHGWP